MQAILSSAFLLPEAPYPEIYYAALLREIVTVQPQGVAPAIGKSLRRLYAALGTGDVECAIIKRMSDWFSAHLSNFNYGWAWKEWVPDMDGPIDHPRRAFVARLVELCVRLAYYDRIKSVLPQELQDGVLAQKEPGPNFTVGDPSESRPETYRESLPLLTARVQITEHPQHQYALEIMKAFRAKASADVIMASLESFRREITDPDDVTMAEANSQTVGTEAQAQIVVRDVAVQSLLEVGSRSFSHFLNVVER